MLPRYFSLGQSIAQTDVAILSHASSMHTFHHDNYSLVSPHYIPPFLCFYDVWKKEEKALVRETNRLRQRLCMVSPPCRVVKRIKGWRDCTGQLLWREDVPSCQTHRCRVMSHCVLEFCQKPAQFSLSLTLSHTLPPTLFPSLSPSPLFSVSRALSLCSVCFSLCVYTLIRLEFYFNECLLCLCLFAFEKWH